MRSIAFPVVVMLVIGMALMMTISTILTLTFLLLSSDTEGRQTVPLDILGKLLQSSKSYTPSGQLKLNIGGISADIIGSAEQQPDFWYLLSDGTQTITHGVVPPSVQKALNTVSDQISSFQFHYTTGEVTYQGLRLVDDANPQAFVVLGGVSFTGVQTIFVALWGIGSQGLYHLLGLVLIATATIAAIAVKRVIASPVRRVVNSAEKIDGLPNGRSISDRDTPSELKPMVAAFNTALSRIDDAFEAQRFFLASASHELRTPLTKLRIKLEKIEEPAIREVLIRDTARLASIVTTSLQLARLSGQSLAFAPVDLAHAARQIVAEHVPAALRQGVEIEFKAPEERIIISGSEAALRVALDNLIMNALCHAQGTEMLVIEVLHPCILRVTDRGPGIPDAERSSMLKPFVRGAGTAVEGAGMGLAIVSQIMSAHNGSVALSDATGGGLVVSLTFPAG
ncbi:HAMP domain-containing sensor histidine kinase [Pseudochrobactrum sp. XF203]|uniref:sensor histidine kinase n=1 Tax=Pseudochrobactrum sp. XF203 TaxID=2879116 RepID=UPI001CE37F36|nr:HAMP domain-containing sensor histidine kinase [Pseudochrobactrum sp. XF203]UCA46135.1 HAMP domain-containing histidine kinase [Pseudochrobactrum sp. XF203]